MKDSNLSPIPVPNSVLNKRILSTMQDIFTSYNESSGLTNMEILLDSPNFTKDALIEAVKVTQEKEATAKSTLIESLNKLLPFTNNDPILKEFIDTIHADNTLRVIITDKFLEEMSNSKLSDEDLQKKMIKNIDKINQLLNKVSGNERLKKSVSPEGLKFFNELKTSQEQKIVDELEERVHKGAEILIKPYKKLEVTHIDKINQLLNKVSSNKRLNSIGLSLSIKPYKKLEVTQEVEPKVKQEVEVKVKKNDNLQDLIDDLASLAEHKKNIVDPSAKYYKYNAIDIEKLTTDIIDLTRKIKLSQEDLEKSASQTTLLAERQNLSKY